MEQSIGDWARGVVVEGGDWVILRRVDWVFGVGESVKETRLNQEWIVPWVWEGKQGGLLNGYLRELREGRYWESSFDFIDLAIAKFSWFWV